MAEIEHFTNIVATENFFKTSPTVEQMEGTIHIATIESWKGPKDDLTDFLALFAEDPINVNLNPPAGMIVASVKSNIEEAGATVSVKYVNPSFSSNKTVDSYSRNASSLAQSVPIEQHEGYLGRVTEDLIGTAAEEWDAKYEGAPIIYSGSGSTALEANNSDVRAEIGVESFYMPNPVFTLEYTEAGFAWSETEVIGSAGSLESPKTNIGGTTALAGATANKWLNMGRDISEVITGSDSQATIKETWQFSPSGWSTFIY